MTPRDAIHRNARGSAADRRARKRWLLATFGDGTTVACQRRSSDRCVGELTLETVTVDRIVVGCEGGRYTHDNIMPSCAPCNYGHGASLRWSHRDA